MDVEILVDRISASLATYINISTKAPNMSNLTKWI